MWWPKYIGLPFSEKGRGPDSFDCWGLAMEIYRTDHPRRIALPGYESLYADSSDSRTIGRLSYDVREQGWREVRKPEAFDLILLRMCGFPMHVGIVTKPGHMVHCTEGIGVTHESFESTRWRNKVLGFFRYG